MQPFPHHYTVTAEGPAEGSVTVSAARLPDLETAAPAEFGGPGDLWSPETLLVAAVSNCFILTFRAIALASNLEWNRIVCKTEGLLDRVERITQFTQFQIHVVLDLPAGSDEAKAKRLLEKSEQNCLITNSLTGKKMLSVEVRVGELATACV